MEKVTQYWLIAKDWLKKEKTFTNADASVIWVLLLSQVFR